MEKKLGLTFYPYDMLGGDQWIANKSEVTNKRD